MKPDIERLLGGYATRSLSDREQQLLMEAALEDQEVFDALAREQVMRDLLEDPRAKRQLLEALENKPGMWSRWTAWMRAPMVLATAGAVAVLAITITSVRYVASWNAPMQVARQQTPPPAVLRDQAIRPAAPAPAAPRRASVPAERPRASEPKKELEVAEQRAPAAAPVAEPQAAPAPAAPSQPVTLAAPGAANTAVPATATAEQSGEPAKDLFYSHSRAPQGAVGGLRALRKTRDKADEPVAKKAAPAPSFGLRATFLRNGAPVDLGTALRGDADLQVSVEPNATGFLYAFVREAGSWRPFWQMPVVAGQAYTAPAAKGAFQASDAVLVALARTPVGVTKTSYSDTEIDVLFPKSQGQVAGNAQNAIFAVNPSAGPDAMVVLRVQLTPR